MHAPSPVNQVLSIHFGDRLGMELFLQPSDHVTFLLHRITTLTGTLGKVFHVGSDALVERLVFLQADGASGETDCGMNTQELIDAHGIQITAELSHNLSKRGYIVRTGANGLLRGTSASEILQS